jgi:hypothetical protein
MVHLRHMATETTAVISQHRRGIIVTTLATLGGVIAGVASLVLVGTDPAAATSVRTVVVFVGAYVAQIPLLQLLGIDVEGFSTKDYLYVAFMTFALWFITYTILLTEGVTI